MSLKKKKLPLSTSDKLHHDYISCLKRWGFESDYICLDLSRRFVIPWITLELRGAVHVTSRHVTSRIASTLAIVWTSWYKLPNLKHFLEIVVFWELCYKASPIQTVLSASYFLEQNGTMQKGAFTEIPKHSIQNRALEKSVTLAALFATGY